MRQKQLGPIIDNAERKALINTINAWSFVVAREDEEFAEALRGGDVLIPDGKCFFMGSSESSVVDNAFMYSVIESCKLNDIDPGKYISYLLDKLKTAREGRTWQASCRATAACKPTKSTIVKENHTNAH